MEINVKSAAFKEGELIPEKYTCSGEGISPPIEWDAAGDSVASYVLICEDPDAPIRTFTHWVLYDLSPETHALPEHVPDKDKLPNGGVHGINSMRKLGYMGPCPPSGTHRYFFKVFALDKKLELGPGAEKEKVLKAMSGHILGEGQLMGKYSK